jgi:hypothetical protein
MNTTGEPQQPQTGGFASDQHLRGELRVTLGALRDLGPRYQPELIDSFMDRLKPRIEQRIQQRLAPEVRPAVTRQPLRSLALGAGAVAAAFLIALPGVAAVARAPHGRFAEPHGFMRMHMMARPHRFGQGAELPDQPLIQPVQPIAP